MKEILTEFDLLQEAMKKIDMNEVAMPIHNGKIVENKESYCKMQQILNAPEMIKSHAFILNLDPEQLEEDEIERVDKLWNLGVNRGFITVDGDEKTDNEIVTGDVRTTEPTPEEKAPEAAFSYKSQKVDVPCWTILYSATDKNGDIKTGECYSNAINTRSAKADCYAKLERCGYSNISILAIEAGDPDNCENDTMLLGKDNGPSDAEVDKAQKEAKISQAQADKALADKTVEEIANESEEDEVEEADTSFDEPKSAHASGVAGNQVQTGDFDKKVVVGKTDDEKAAEGADYKTLYSEFLTAADDYKQIADLQGENSIAAKNAFKEVQGAYEDCYAAVPSDEDERELLSQINSYGFKLAADNCTILESEEEMVDESGNPYLAGMKTADLNGQMKVSAKGPAKPKKAAAKKTKIEEDDEDSSDGESDDGDSGDNDGSESEDTSSDDSSDDNSDDSDNSSDDDSSDDNEDDSDNEEVSDDSDDDSEEDNDSDDSEESDDEESDEESDETKDDESTDSDDDSDDEKDEKDSDEDSSDEESDDEETDDEEPEEKESKELSDEEKAQYKSDYKKTFKDTMLKCKFEDKCFDDLSIAEKVEFFTKLQKAWKKNEPKDFMSDKEIEQLNKVVVKK